MGLNMCWIWGRFCRERLQWAQYENTLCWAVECMGFSLPSGLPALPTDSLPSLEGAVLGQSVWDVVNAQHKNVISNFSKQSCTLSEMLLIFWLGNYEKLKQGVLLCCAGCVAFWKGNSADCACGKSSEGLLCFQPCHVRDNTECLLIPLQFWSFRRGRVFVHRWVSVSCLRIVFHLEIVLTVMVEYLLASSEGPLQLFGK